MSEQGSGVRVRREPPAFRRVEVVSVAEVTPRLVRVTVGGPELEGLVVEQPAASVRLLLPPALTKELVMPTWNGNEFLLADGRRPAIRTLTPLRVDQQNHQMDLEIVVHEGGAASAWALQAQVGDEAALSGPGRGYAVDPEAEGFLLGGDESAIPAISQLLEVLPEDKPIQVMVEVAAPEARLDLPKHSGANVEWLDLPEGAPPGDALVTALTRADIPDGHRVFAAGEAAAMQRIRRHLLDERQLPRSATWIRGYWKTGRAGDAGDD